MSTHHRYLLAGIAAWLLSVSAAHAHLMVSQRGTLNMVDRGVYMVVSIPVSALTGVDDDGDAKLSLQELREHARDIETQVQRGIQLVGKHGAYPMDGVVLNTSPPDDAPTAAADQIVVMGRFEMHPRAADTRFIFKLFGRASTEQTQQITVTRGPETQLMTLTPERDQAAILPVPWRVFYEQAVSGATHIWTGADHLLFLLVVLAAGWSLGSVVMALTCFTVGHATTLVASTWLGFSVSPAIVEPAIAATIVGMALFDRYCVRNQVHNLTALRMSLVFGCALIHGLGLAEAFSDMGLASDSKLISLAGFNVGIEVGQLAVIALAAVVLKLVSAIFGGPGLTVTTRLASFAAVGMGSFWMIERLA